jgi:hypothetical protein
MRILCRSSGSTTAFDPAAILYLLSIEVAALEAAW